MYCYHIFGGVHQWACPKMDGLYWGILSKWMIFGGWFWWYRHFRKPPHVCGWVILPSNNRFPNRYQKKTIPFQDDPGETNHHPYVAYRSTYMYNQPWIDKPLGCLTLRLFNWGSTIYVPFSDYLEVPSQFRNHGWYIQSLHYIKYPFVPYIYIPSRKLT